MTPPRLRSRVVHFVPPGQSGAACGSKFFTQGTPELRLVSCSKCKAAAEPRAEVRP